MGHSPPYHTKSATRVLKTFPSEPTLHFKERIMTRTQQCSMCSNVFKCVTMCSNAIDGGACVAIVPAPLTALPLHNYCKIVAQLLHKRLTTTAQVLHKSCTTNRQMLIINHSHCTQSVMIAKIGNYRPNTWDPSQDQIIFEPPLQSPRQTH